MGRKPLPRPDDIPDWVTLLRRERRGQGLTQPEVGERMGGISFATISNWERDRYNITARSAEQWANALGYTFCLCRIEAEDAAP